MTTSINVNRQSVLYAEREIAYDDFVVAAGNSLVDLFYVHGGTRVLGGFLDITTAWTVSSTGTALISIGDAYTGGYDVDRYLAGTTDLETAALTKFTLPPVTGAVIPNSGSITATVTVAGGTVSTGAATVGIWYIETGRVTEFMTRRS